MSQGHDPVAHFGSYSDYFFIDDGVLKVRVVSPLAWLSFTLILVVISGFLLRFVVPTSTTNNYVLGSLGLGCLVAGYFLQLVVANRKRQKLSGLNSSQIRNLAIFYSWSDIESISDDRRGKTIIIRTTRKAYRMTVANSDFERILSLASVKLCKAPSTVAPNSPRP